VVGRQAQADPGTICRSYWLLNGNPEKVLDKKILTAASGPERPYAPEGDHRDVFLTLRPWRTLR